MLNYYDNYIKGRYVFSRLEKSLMYKKDDTFDFRKQLVDYVYAYESENKYRAFIEFLPLVLFLYNNQKDVAYTTEPNSKGIKIFLNPNHFKSHYPLVEEWEFIFSHECLHQVWDTFNVADRIKQKDGGCYMTVLNIASDCIINETLKSTNRVVPKSLISAESIKKDFDVDYEESDTQYSLYYKIINSDKFKQNDPKNKQNGNQQQQQQGGNQQQNDNQQQGGNKQQNDNQQQGGNKQQQQQQQSGNQQQDDNQQQGGNKQQQQQQQGDNQQQGGGNNNQQGENEEPDEESQTGQQGLYDYDTEVGNNKNTNSERGEKEETGVDDDDDTDSSTDKDGKGEDKEDSDSDKKDGKGEGEDEENSDESVNSQEDSDSGSKQKSSSKDNDGEQSDNDKEEDETSDDNKESDSNKKGKQNQGSEEGESGKEESEENSNGIGNEKEKEIGKGRIITSAELNKQFDKALDIAKNTIGGPIGEFMKKCNSSERLELPSKDQVKIKLPMGATGAKWDDALIEVVEDYMDQLLRDDSETRPTWNKINRRFGRSRNYKGNEILVRGEKAEDKTLLVKFAFFIDGSGSMAGERIEGAGISSNGIADMLDDEYVEELERKFANDDDNNDKKQEDEKFEFYVFYRHDIKKIQRREMPVDGNCGTMPCAQLFSKFSEYGKDCLINIIYTDAGQEFDKESIAKYIESNDALNIYISCTSENDKMLLELEKQFEGKFKYIRSTNDFKVLNKEMRQSHFLKEDKFFNIKKLKTVPLFEQWFFKE